MKSVPRLVLMVTLLSTFGLVSAQVAGTAATQPSMQQDGFRRRSQLLLDNQSSMSADAATNRASLDRKKLLGKNLTTDDLKFLQELTDFSNDVLDASKTAAGLSGAQSQLAKYPKVKEYFTQASAMAAGGQALSLRKKSQHNPFTSFAIVGNPIAEALGMSDCGIYWSPKPNAAKSRVTYNVKDAVATLKSWGYHDSLIPGAGWTRAQTWHPWNCGFSTFRDNANPVSKTQLWEQNYNGWNPRGEPNPEVYASGPWPYSTWPAYVYWWHATF